MITWKKRWGCVQVLNDKQIEQLVELKDFIGSNLTTAWNEVVCCGEECKEFLCKRKIVMILMDRMFRSIGLEGYKHLAVISKEGLGTEYTTSVQYANYEDSYDLGGNIENFYSHYLYQLGYENNEIDISYVLEQIEAECDISEIASEYEVSEHIIEIIKDNDDVTFIEEGQWNIWHNTEIESFLKDYDIREYDYVKELLNSVMEPVFMCFDDFKIQICEKGVFEYGYLLFLDTQEVAGGFSGLDFFLTDMIDAVLLHDQILKIRQTENSTQVVACHV